MTILADTLHDLARVDQTGDELAARRWSQQLQRNRSQEVKGNLANVAMALESAPELAGIVAFDEFTCRTLLIKRPPWEQAFNRRAWKDADDAELLTWLQQNGIPATAISTVVDAVRMVAERHRFDALKDYLNNLVWDGKRRLDHWIVTNLDAEDSDLARAMGRMFLISAVARGLSPGCQADHVLVLEGPQGGGKSSAARILGGLFTQEHLPDFHSKDAAASLAGCWIVELSELAALSRSEVESVKSFVSRREDRYRPAYGRHVIEQPRRCVFIATTNEKRYLRDSTGNRRFWPVRVGRIDLGGLAEVREQLLAQAVAAYRAGAPWHLTDANTIRHAQDEQNARLEHDPWKTLVVSFLSGKQETTTCAILDWLEVDRGRQHAGLAKRITGIMRGLGWIEREDRSGGTREIVWRQKP